MEEGLNGDLPNPNPAGWRGYFRASRTDDALELLKLNPLALVLAYVIANRAKWRNGFDRHGLSIGEAFIGDHDNYGMSERCYRTAKSQLAKWCFATFKTTNKGTIAKLIDTRLFEIVAGSSDEQNADKRRTGDEPADRQETTNLELKSGERKSEKAYSTTKGAKKLSMPQWEIARRIEAALVDEWVNDAGKWINRIKADRKKCERVIAEVEQAARESRIKTTPARYAEQIWKEFAP